MSLSNSLKEQVENSFRILFDARHMNNMESPEQVINQVIDEFNSMIYDYIKNLDHLKDFKSPNTHLYQTLMESYILFKDINNSIKERRGEKNYWLYFLICKYTHDYGKRLIDNEKNLPTTIDIPTPAPPQYNK